MTLVVLAVGALAGLAGLAWTVASPQRSAFVMAAMVITDASSVAESDFGVQGPILPVAGAVYLGAGHRLWMARRPLHDLPFPPFAAYAAIAVAAVVMSAAAGGFTAEVPDNSYDTTFELVKNLFIAGSIFVVAIEPSGFRGALFGLLAGGGGLATITTFQLLTGGESNNWFGFSSWSVETIAGTGDTARAVGPFGDDPNAYAQYLVVALAVAGALAASRVRSLTQRFVSLVLVGFILIAIAATASRGGLLALGAVGAVLVMATKAPVRMAVLAATAATILAVLGPVDVGARLETLGEVATISDGEPVLADRSLRGRASEMIAAWEMFVDHPIAGVGYGGYNDRYLEYSREIGLDPRFEDRSAHSLPLEIAAEGGIIGIIAWGGLFAVAIIGGIQLSRRAPSLGTALMAAFAGFGVTAIFLHDVHPRLMMLLLALGIAGGFMANTRPSPRRNGDGVRVAMVIQNYLPSVGGAERQLASLVPLLKERGITPIVVTRGREGRPEHDTINGGQVIRVPVGGPKVVQSIQFVDRASRVIRELDVDAVIAFDSLTPSTIGRELARTERIHYATKILRSGELGDLQRLERKRFGRRRLRNLLHSSSAFITISTDIDRELAVRGVREDRRRSIPNGVDTDRFKPSAPVRARIREELALTDEPMAIMTGRVAPEKRVVEIARRWHEVRARESEAVLVVAGDGPLLGELAGLDGVIALGRREDVPDLLAAADLYLSASVAEGLSNSLLEAMSAGLACVVTDVGGVGDVITDGADGIVKDPRDLDGILDAVAEVVVDRDRQLELAAAARSRVEARYKIDTTADALSELCRALAASGAVHRPVDAIVPHAAPASAG